MNDGLMTPLYPTLHWNLPQMGVRDLCTLASKERFGLLLSLTNQEASDAVYKAVFDEMVSAHVLSHYCRLYKETIVKTFPDLELPPTPSDGARMVGTMLDFPKPNLPAGTRGNAEGGGRYMFFREEGVELSEFMKHPQSTSSH